MLKEIKISPSAIMKKHKNGSNLVSVGPREKVWINDPPQFFMSSGKKIQTIYFQQSSKKGIWIELFEGSCPRTSEASWLQSIECQVAD